VRVYFLGRVSEEAKWQIFMASDAYASTTMHEGFGLACIEAMVAGLLVVTNDHGGQTDFLVHGATGRLVPAGAPDAMVAALVALAADPDGTRRMRAANRFQADRHRIKACAVSDERIFENALARHPVAAVGPAR
jgi:glycosyltransferase involved in cell wall biosynthesis